jgi:mannose-1-phosphate guanylyltransferase
MFLFDVGAWIDELERHSAALLRGCEAALVNVIASDGVIRLSAAFEACPANSIDYAVMEKTSRAAVVPLAAGWNDVGSWSSLQDVVPKDSHGNASAGDVILDGCRNTYVVARDRLVAAIGLDGVVIVETDEAVLVVSRDHAEAVKRVAEHVGKRGPPDPAKKP